LAFFHPVWLFFSRDVWQPCRPHGTATASARLLQMQLKQLVAKKHTG